MARLFRFYRFFLYCFLDGFFRNFFAFYFFTLGFHYYILPSIIKKARNGAKKRAGLCTALNYAIWPILTKNSLPLPRVVLTDFTPSSSQIGQRASGYTSASKSMSE